MLTSAHETVIPRFASGIFKSGSYRNDASYAWRFHGGDGSGRMKFVDIEQGWIFNHEDIRVNQLPTTGLNHYQHCDHGAAVLGIIMMQDNNVGGIGITPKADGYVISQWRPNGSFNTADAIMAAIDHLDVGDVLLLEAQSFDILYTERVGPVESDELRDHSPCYCFRNNCG